MVPAIMLPPTPTPPVTTNAADVDDVAAVLLDTVNTPTEFNDVWNIEAPVIPIPPEVTSNAAE